MCRYFRCHQIPSGAKIPRFGFIPTNSLIAEPDVLMRLKPEPAIEHDPDTFPPTALSGNLVYHLKTRLNFTFHLLLGLLIGLFSKMFLHKNSVDILCLTYSGYVPSKL
jgi:hypothetical protein